MEKLRFLTPDLAEKVRQHYGTPAYVYDLKSLRENARIAQSFPHAYGLTVRYAMKASPNAAILKVFSREGLHIDSSSGYEVSRALLAGIAPSKISLSSQELPSNFNELYQQGIAFNACSLRQLDYFGQQFPGQALGLRFNPGVGSGGTGKTNVGGPDSSFGIWHECLDEVKAIVEKYKLRVIRIHTHIGSGSDPEVWQRASHLSINLVKEFPDVEVLNLGGGFKVGRMKNEVSTDLAVVGAPIKIALEEFKQTTGRALHLEIEPGTFLLANACALVTVIQDQVHTGTDGYHFLKLDAGMTEVLRPSLYGAQHPIVLIPKNDTGEQFEYLVVGHCCESGDLLTPAPDSPEKLMPQKLAKAMPGDICVIEGVGAYCSSMSCINYNSFPQAAELLLDERGSLHLIRERQNLNQMLQNERVPEGI